MVTTWFTPKLILLLKNILQQENVLTIKIEGSWKTIILLIYSILIFPLQSKEKRQKKIAFTNLLLEQPYIPNRRQIIYRVFWKNATINR